MNFKMGIPRIDNPWTSKKKAIKKRRELHQVDLFFKVWDFFIIFHIGVSIILIVGLTSRIDNVNNAQKTHELTTAKKDPVHLQMAVSQLKVLPIQELFPSRNCKHIQHVLYTRTHFKYQGRCVYLFLFRRFLGLILQVCEGLNSHDFHIGEGKIHRPKCHRVT